MRRILALLVAAALFVVGGAAAATASQDSTCPRTDFTEADGGWVKYDGLTGTSFTVPQKSGFTVDQICYKAATEVVPIGATGTVVSTVTNQNGNVQELSHVSVHYQKDAPPPPVEVPVTAPAYTAPTCDAPGSLVYSDTAQYVWQASGPESARLLTASPVGDVVLTGQTVFGPYNLEQLTGEQCEEPPAEVPVVPPVFTAPSCDAPGELVYADTAEYEWIESGDDSARVLTASPIGDVVLVGETVFGPYDLTQLTGDQCDEGDDETQKVPLCHATGSAENPYVFIEVSVAAFFNAGHIDHEDDIFDTFTFTKHGEEITVPAQGDLALLANGCKVEDEPELRTDFEYVLDCDYVLTGFEVTYRDDEEISREALEPRTITPEEADELGLSIPDDCEVLDEVIEFEYQLDCDYLLTGDKVTYVDGEEVEREALEPRTITPEEAEELGLSIPDDCDVAVFGPIVSVTEPVCLKDDEDSATVDVFLDNIDSTMAVWFAVWVDGEPVADVELEAGESDVLELVFEAGTYDVVVEAIGEGTDDSDTYAIFETVVVVDCDEDDGGVIVKPVITKPGVKPVIVAPVVTKPPALAYTGVDGTSSMLLLAAGLIGLGGLTLVGSRRRWVS